MLSLGISVSGAALQRKSYLRIFRKETARWVGPHFKETPIYVFPEKKLRGESSRTAKVFESMYSQKSNCATSVLVSSFMCLWVIYIFRSAHLYSCSRIGTQIVGIYKHDLGTRPRSSFPGNICFEFFFSIAPLHCSVCHFASVLHIPCHAMGVGWILNRLKCLWWFAAKTLP